MPEATEQPTTPAPIARRRGSRPAGGVLDRREGAGPLLVAFPAPAAGVISATRMTREAKADHTTSPQKPVRQIAIAETLMARRHHPDTTPFTAADRAHLETTIELQIELLDLLDGDCDLDVGAGDVDHCPAEDVQTYALVTTATEDDEPDVDGEDNDDAEPPPNGYIRARRAIPVTVHQPIEEHGTRQFQGRLLSTMYARGVIHHYRVEGDDGLLYLTPPGWVAGVVSAPALTEAVA
jgi:hypothetical protein